MGANAFVGYVQGDQNNAVLDAKKTVGVAQIDSQNLLAEADAASQNVLRGANNTLSAAQVALSNFQRSAANSQKLESAGNAVNASVVNMARIADKSTQGSLERQLASAEQLGAVQAASAARGVGGSTGRMLQATLAATSARRESQISDAQTQVTFDMLMQRSGLMSGAIRSLDEGQTFAPLDFTTVLAKKTIAPIWEADYAPSAGWQAIMAAANNTGSAIDSVNSYMSQPSSSGSMGSTSSALFGTSAGTWGASSAYGAGNMGLSTSGSFGKSFGAGFKFSADGD